MVRQQMTDAIRVLTRRKTFGLDLAFDLVFERGQLRVPMPVQGVPSHYPARFDCRAAIAHKAYLPRRRLAEIIETFF